ncbi:ABC transporter ATP-binding protein [Bacteroides pyogenes]|uniref:ABC transporter ATP-binding protein n=1 Tax=Bacteroides pyogenes TaxID=310300 RepID=UPI00068FA75F|nr:ABC transporter ATP-binding protein [Bacteroides pyogenes]
MVTDAIRNITIGRPWLLYKPVGYTMLANFINIIPFCLSIEVINTLFSAFDGTGTPLEVSRLWMLIAIMYVYIVLMVWGEKKSYHANFQEAYRMSAEGRVALAEHLRRLSLGSFYKKDSGELSSMLITDFAMAEQGMSHHLPRLLGALVMPLFAFLGLLFVDWRMSVAMFIALPVSFSVLLLTSDIQRKLGQTQIAAKIRSGSRMEEYLQGIRVIKAYNMTGKKFARLREAFDQLKRANIKTEALIGPIVMLSVTLLRFGLTLMILCGTYLLIGGALSVSVFVMFLIVGSRVFDPLTLALINLAEFRYYSIAGERIRTLLDELEIPGTKDAPDRGDIYFRDVSFRYDEAEVLHNINITMRQGSLTALVGPSGSGKSTLMKLCARFYDPSEGTIMFGNRDIREVDPEKLMQRISMVFQDVYLFQDTIKNNIRFGKENATDAEIMAAAKKAQCHDFIMQLPMGYDTRVGEGGCTLSGGEKQRISIARAILKDAPVILLDEATASLDPENEVEIQSAINSLIQGRTVIVIAHKLRTISDADHIIVLDNGYVVEQGTHELLLENKGLYARLWEIQEKSYGWKVDNTEEAWRERTINLLHSD